MPAITTESFLKNAPIRPERSRILPLIQKLNALFPHVSKQKRNALPLSKGRKLKPAEVEQLKAQGNRCEDWSLLRVPASFDPGSVVGNLFSGANYLGITKTNPEDPKPNGLSRNNHAGRAGLFSGNRVVRSSRGGSSQKRLEADSAGFPSGKAFRPGIFFSNLSGCAVQNARLQNVFEVKNYFIEAGASLKNIGSLTWEPGWNLGMGQAIHPGSETGERRLWFLEQSSLDEYLWCLQRNPREQKKLEKHILKIGKSYASRFGYIGSGSLIAHVKELHNTWVDDGTVIQSALKLRHVTLLNPANDRRTLAVGYAKKSRATATSGKTGKEARDLSHEEIFIGAGTYLKNCLVKEGVYVDTGAIVKDSILLEHCEVEERAVVNQSLLGPNSSIGKGEVTACFLGPFTTSHHQSLLIATLWPEGKGNVGHGSSLGSNHTGKKPDQEMSVGEGVFFGLDSRVKFPCNLSEAPYSLLAAGTSLAPQKISFPFSLILSGETAGTRPFNGSTGGNDSGTRAHSRDASGSGSAGGEGMNAGSPDTSRGGGGGDSGTRETGGSRGGVRIIPGWMWWENPYALFRNMYKYRQREKRVPAPHHTLFNPHLAELVVKAYHSLKDLRPGETEWLDSSHCSGLGKTHMRTKDLAPAMEAYRDFLYIYWWETKARKEKVPASLQKRLAKILESPTERTSKNKSRVSKNTSPASQKTTHLKLLRERLILSLEKDDRRGARIFDDYSAFHPPIRKSVASDPVLREFSKDMRNWNK